MYRETDDSCRTTDGRQIEATLRNYLWEPVHSHWLFVSVTSWLFLLRAFIQTPLLLLTHKFRPDARSRYKPITNTLLMYRDERSHHRTMYKYVQ